jgi:hypothetical protein
MRLGQEWLTDTCNRGLSRNFLPSYAVLAAFSALLPAGQKSSNILKYINFSLWHSFCNSSDAAAWESGRRTGDDVSGEGGFTA